MKPCPECLKANVVASIDGPTCPHQMNSGLLWFPAWWDSAPESQRLVWLESKNK